MNILKSLVFCAAAVCAAPLIAQGTPAKPAAAPDATEATTKSIRAGAEKLVLAFNSGKADEVAALFMADGELVDEGGTVYQGQKEIQELASGFFTRFPETKLTIDIESIRLAGPVAIEEGTRTMKNKDGETQSQFRYVAVWAKSKDAWKIASFRDFDDSPAPSANEQLQSLAWMVGDWVNQGADGSVSISYRWSEDKNFLLGEFSMTSASGSVRKSSQRLGWDPIAGKIRSWLFDPDGGFSEGTWTVLDDSVVAKSNTVNPDGTAASATLTIVQKDKDHFTISGTDRIVGNSREPDFDLTVARRPPAVSK